LINKHKENSSSLKERKKIISDESKTKNDNSAIEFDSSEDANVNTISLSSELAKIKNRVVNEGLYDKI